MDYGAAILYAMKQMRKIGKSPDEYDFEPIRVFPTPAQALSGSFVISAYNELYILVDPERYFGLFILADNSAFNSENPAESGVPEFTGNIRFTKIAASWNFQPTVDHPIAIPVEFLRVVY